APPFLSIIVPVRNEERFIGRTLSQLFVQDYPPDRYEILVADGASTDCTPAIVRGFTEQTACLHLIENRKRLSSAGRTQAVLASRGDISLLVGGHGEIARRSYLRAR